MTDPPELSELVPRLTRSTISDDERATLYHAAMQGHHLPLGVKRWKRVTHRKYHWKDMTTAEIKAASMAELTSDVLDGLECPGCGHHVAPHDAGPLPCDGCGNVYLVAPETP